LVAPVTLLFFASCFEARRLAAFSSFRARSMIPRLVISVATGSVLLQAGQKRLHGKEQYAEYSLLPDELQTPFQNK
jgi:hypothetical protein